MSDGTYEGLGEGRGGIIKLAVDIKEHRIETARVLAQSESSFAQSCIDDMIGRVIEAQSADVDAISGATLTSNGVKSAMKMAIDKAYGRFSSNEKRDFIGGNTNSSTGGINGAETSFQKDLGIIDSKDVFFDDIGNRLGGNGVADIVVFGRIAGREASNVMR